MADAPSGPSVLSHYPGAGLALPPGDEQEDGEEEDEGRYEPHRGPHHHHHRHHQQLNGLISPDLRHIKALKSKLPPPPPPLNDERTGAPNGLERLQEEDGALASRMAACSLLHHPGQQEEEEEDGSIRYVRYESELQMPDIMRLITKDLSEPYSIYTYRYFIHNWPQLCFLMDPGAGDRRSKSTEKRRHLQCRRCEVPLPDDSEYTTCASCRPAPPLSDAPTIQDVVIWMQNSMQRLEEKLTPAKKRRRHSCSPEPMDEDCKIVEDADDSSSLSSEEEVELGKIYFPAEKAQKLIKYVQTEGRQSTEGEVQSTSKGSRTFKFEENITSLMEAEWEKPEKAPVVSKRFKLLYPLDDSQSKDWVPPPKVDTAIAKLSKRTIVPADDGSNLRDPMDRRVEVALKRVYIAGAGQNSVAGASFQVSRALRSWLSKIQEQVESGVRRDAIVAAFSKVNMAIDFLCDSSSQQVRFASKTMALSTAGRRALWLKPWSGDNTSKFHLCNLKFAPGRLFGSELDTLMEDLSDKKGKSLPQVPKPSKRYPPKRRSPQRNRQDRYSSRGRGARSSKRGGPSSGNPNTKKDF